jgi:polygalacturonase
MSRITRRQSLKWAGMLAAMHLAGCASLQRTKSTKVFDVQKFGAVGDGVKLDTIAIQNAIDAAATSGGQVLIRGGRKYLIGTLTLKPGIDFHLADDAELLVSTNALDYAGAAAIVADGATGLTITGSGSINGRSPEFMDHFDANDEWWRPKKFRPRLFQLTGCNDLQVTGITIQHAPSWSLHLVGCRRVLVDGIKIRNQLDVPNCDGIDPDHCQDVEIRNCDIVCGDDAICIKTSRDGAKFGPSSKIVVKDCIVQTQDAGLKIGTETTQDIHDIRFERCDIKSSSRGLCIQLRDEGSIYNVSFRDITFTAQYHSDPWWGRGEAISFTAIPRNPAMKVGTIHDVQLTNITGKSENSIRVSGSEKSRIRNVLMENVSVTLDRWTKYPGGVFDNRPTTAVQAVEPHTNPGIYLRHADHVTVRDCKMTWGDNRPDYFTHALQAEDCKDLSMPGFTGEAAHPDRYNAVSTR